jgi:hypothetical protein
MPPATAELLRSRHIDLNARAAPCGLLIVGAGVRAAGSLPATGVLTAPAVDNTDKVMTAIKPVSPSGSQRLPSLRTTPCRDGAICHNLEQHLAPAEARR